MRSLTIGENDRDQRLDRFINKYLPSAPKSWVQKMIRKKRIKVNKKRAQPGQTLKLGDQVNFYIYDEVLAPFEASREGYESKIPLSIVFENDDLAIIDKPAGVLSHAASAKDYGHNIVDAFVSYLIKKGDYRPRWEHSFTPALANRLDYNTPGLLIGLKSHQAAVQVNQAIQDQAIGRYYRCYCSGRIDRDQKIDLALTKQGQTMKGAQPGQGQEALTLIHPLDHGEGWTYLDVQLVTGRYHQIRAHLQAIGHPILGDRRYGKEGAGSKFHHQLLLSYRLTFPAMPDLGLEKGLDVISKQLKDFEGLAKDL